MGAPSLFRWISSCCGGARDKRTTADYGANILGARRAIPALLDLFAARQIRCTWATVGFLFCADKDELMASFPPQLPRYRDRRLSPYDDLADLGRDEESDPYRYGLSLLRQIQSRPGQEIATHTFSHYYCLEKRAPTSTPSGPIWRPRSRSPSAAAYD